MVETLIQFTVNGIVFGALIALATLGLTLIWGVQGFPNVAQGDLLTLGAYFTLAFSGFVPVPVAGVLSVAATAGVSVVIYRGAFKRLAGAPFVVLFIVSMGVSPLIRGVIGLIWGSEIQNYPVPVMRNLRFGQISINPIDIGVALFATVAVVVLYVIMYRTRIGVEMRAVSDTHELARVSGISTDRVLQYTWLLAGGVTGAAGALLGAEISVRPVMGWNLLIPMFAAASLGGIGSLPGTIVAGVVIGVASSVSTIWISPSYQVAIALGVLTLVLLLRPRGLFAK